MSNIPTVQACYAAFGRGDVAGILSHLSDDVHWEQWDENSAQAAGVPWLLPRHGKAEVAEFFALLATFEFHEFDVRNFMEGGGKVAVELVVDVTLPHGRVRDEEIHLFAFDGNGKIKAFRHHLDTARNIAAAGL